MQGVGYTLLAQVPLGVFLVICGALVITFHRKLTAYRIKSFDWLPWYIHGGAAGSLMFRFGTILFGIVLIL